MITLIDLIVIFIIFCWFILFATNKRIFVYSKHPIAEGVDSFFITLHFIHASVYKKIASNLSKEAVRLIGGHIEIQIDEYVYGFETKYKNKIPHIISYEERKNFNGVFLKKDFLIWLEESKGELITSVKVPVTLKQKQKLIELYEKNLKETPYDYAFFGMRCASSAYQMLGTTGIVPAQESNTRYIMSSFFPRLFRKMVLSWANYNGFEVSVKEGRIDRYWER